MNVKIKNALNDAKQPWGPGWTSLTHDHRNALVVSALAGHFTLMDPEDLSMERRSALLVEWQALINEALGIEF